MHRIAAPISALAVAMSLGQAPAIAQSNDFEFDVDLELVLAVDVSRSMDIEEQQIQRQGYIDALRHPDVIEAALAGPLGRIAVTYFEWAGPGDRTLIVPWTLIGSVAEAEAFAAKLSVAPRTRISGTSISGAILYGGALFGQAFNGYRQTMDISGDGPNNAGGPVLDARDAIVARGITINGLPIMLNKVSSYGPYGVPNLDLDVYYEDCVIGGPGAFMVPVRDVNNFAEAIRQKLILEIAGIEPRIIPAADTAGQRRVDCLIGEKSRRGWYFNDR